MSVALTPGELNVYADGDAQPAWRTDGPRARAFNRGCDARLAGVPVECCPHGENTMQGSAWIEGWWDIEVNWGKAARWPVDPLPEVRRRAS